MPVIARFLLVVTFYEDSLRIITQWDDQVFFLRKHRSMVGGSAQLFLFLNVLVMLVASTLAVARRYTEYAVAGLSLVVVAQSIGYGFIFDSSFFFRALSVVGGLLMLLADAFASSKRKVIFAGLPSINETDKNAYIQLFARILLVGLFLSFIVQGEFTFLRLTVSAIALVGCVMVVVGFKARWSAWMLVAFLSIFNVVLNSWWNLPEAHPQRDFLKYDFFQTLSIVGGFLLLVNLGPGGLSVDEKKKNF
ncbi:SURF4 family-domain-containing protein [Cladochytrium replicatum]|nr:SURF4 family-domain-containing protein [Cladochytrium replicatum]